MKLKDILQLVTESETPKSNVHYHLYSLPSFDDNQTREEVIGKDIMSNKFVVPNRCILFNKLNVRFKRIWKINNLDSNKLASTEFLPLVVNETIADYNYVYYLLRSDSLTNYLCGQNSNTSGSHKRIDPNVLLNMEINLPKRSVQECIGKMLSSLDNKIALNREINRNLEAMARQLYDYWFVQFDFPDANGNPYKSSGGKMVWNEKLKREIPDGWDYTTLLTFADIQNGATPSTANENNYGGEIVWITPKDLSDQAQKFTFMGERTITQKGYDSCSTKMLPKGTILMSSRAPIGLLSISAVELCTNQGFKSFVPTKSYYSRYLLYLVLQNLPYIKQMGSGTTFSEVSKDELSKLYVEFAPNKLIQEFDKRLEPIFSRQKVLVEEIYTLTQQRDEILPLLMNGQVSVMPSEVNCDLSHD